MRVMAVDSGQSTGVCIVDFLPDKQPELIHLQQKKQDFFRTMYSLRTAINRYGPQVVVAEQFDLRPGNKFLADLSPVGINHALAWELFNVDYMKVNWQTPAQAKGLVKDQVLKNLGFWPTGKTVDAPDAHDARDALRHAVHYAVKELKHQPTMSTGWPRTEEDT